MLPGNTNVIDVCQIHEEKEREREHMQKINGFQVTILLNRWNVNDQM